jgi:hypothetical protein
MKIVAFYAKQIFGLGTLGFVLWLCIGWWKLGWFWAADTHWAWLIALALVGLFLVLVCTPIQLAVKSVKKDGLAYALGAISGPTAVLLHLALNTRFQLTINDYVVRHAYMHVLFAFLGLLFAINYRRRFGPNNSFKPRPLRGLGLDRAS